MQNGSEDRAYGAFQLLLEATIPTWEVQGWSLNLNWEELSWEELGSISDTVTVCLPLACFDVTTTYDFPVGGGLESLVIEVLLGDEPPLVLVDFQNGVVQRLRFTS